MPDKKQCWPVPPSRQAPLSVTTHFMVAAHGADRARYARIIARTYDNADRCVCGLGGNELMRLLVGHPEHFPDVTDGHTLAGQVMG